MLRDVSSNDKNLKQFKKRIDESPELYSLLPPRRTWIRLRPEERKIFSSGDKSAIEEIKRTVFSTDFKVKTEDIEPPIWYINLKTFIGKIKSTINDPGSHKLNSPTILPKRKDNKKTCNEYRPISQFDLQERVIIGQTTKYLTNLFDSEFAECSLAFRSKSSGKTVPTHHDAIDKILDFREKNKTKTIYVAECDIKKFFDCVNHESLIRSFDDINKFILKRGESIDERAKVIFYKYLECYSFNKTVLPLNSNGYFNDRNNLGQFTWPMKELKNLFYGGNIDSKMIGVPQGGALSCLIANIFMHDLDVSVLATIDVNKTFYCRFCDDMILLSTDINDLNQGIQTYIDTALKKQLLVHKPEQTGLYGKHFYNFKSKLPYEWSSDKGKINSSPWISFVGYQIRFDGSIRVRKKSVEKEISKQRTKVQNILDAIAHKNESSLNQNSRKSSKQQIIALESRLINMAVGRIQAHDLRSSKIKLCWGAGFKRLNDNATVRQQLKHLDRKRNRELYLFRKRLLLLNKKSHKADPDFPNKLFRGSPYSYFGLLHRK